MNCNRISCRIKCRAQLVVAIASVAILSHAVRVTAAEGDLVPRELLERWRLVMENANALEFEWSAERKCLLTPEEFKKMLHYPGPPEEFPYRERARYTILHPRIRAYRRIERLASPSVSPKLSSADPSTVDESSAIPSGRFSPPEFRSDVLEQEVAIDDGLCYEGTWHLDGPDLRGDHKMLFLTSLEELRTTDGRGRIAWPEFLIESGFFLPATAREIGRPPVPLPLHWIEGFPDSPRLKSADGDGPEIHLVFENAGTIEDLVVEFDQGYRIREWKTFDQRDRLLLQRIFTGRKAVPGTGLILPTSIEKRYFHWETNPEYVSSKPCIVDSYELERADNVPVSDDLFLLKYDKPGDFIADRTLKEARNLPAGQVQYRIPANPADLDSVIAAAKRGEIFYGGSGSSRIWFLVWINLAVLAVTGGLWFFRRRTR